MTEPVQAAWAEVPTAAGAMPVYRVTPPSGRGPGLLLWQEIFGVNRHIRAMAHTWALHGFTVYAPDVFWRQTTKTELGYEGEDRQRGRAHAMALKPDELRADIEAAAAALRTDSAVAGGRIGTIGWCLGGRLAWFTAAWAAADAAVAYYGGGIHDQLALAERVKCPMQFHYAELDEHIPLEAVMRVRGALKDHDAAIHVYADARHGFNCWDRADYSARAAALAHGRSLSFLASHLF